MKKKWTEKQIFIFLLTLNCVLIFMVTVGFLCRKKKYEPEKIVSALLNVHFVSEIDRIIIKDAQSEGIVLQKTEGVWIGCKENSPHIFWPVDVQTVHNLLRAATEVTSMNVVAHSQKDWERFNLQDSAASSLLFLSADETVLSHIYFGNINNLANRVAIRTWTKQDVFETDAAIAFFATSDISFWVDPFIYPQCISGYSRYQSESLLRHGRILEETFSLTEERPFFEKRVFFENGSAIQFYIYKNGKKTDFIVHPVFFASSIFLPVEQEAIHTINYRYAISSVTFERLLEEIQQ